MLNIQIICIGKLKEKYLKDACEEYSKRLKSFCKFSIIELPEEKTIDAPNQSKIEHILDCEGERILKKIPNTSKVIALCIEGKGFSSEDFSVIMAETAVEGISSITFVIGGSWGISGKVKNIADVKLSMSKMTFPHQLARVMLCEQIYRGFQISSGGKYHK